MKNKILSLLLAGTIISAAATAQAGSTGVWTGFDISPDSYFIYLGAMTALQGQDIQSQDGWLLRGDAGYGEYDYDTVAVPGGNVDGDVSTGDILVGYRHFFPAGYVTGFLGGDIQHHNISPNDPGNSVDGSEGGVKGALELFASPAANIEIQALGNYSTAFDSYWSRLTVGYNFGPVTIGPEVRFLGNEEFHQVRYGASISGFDIGFANVSINGGYANTSDRGDDGAYGGIGFGANF